MKETIRTMSALLTMMVAMTILAFTFTACSDDEDVENEVTYTYGFAKMSASHPDFLEEMGKIENAFKSALGTTGSNFTKRGTVEESGLTHLNFLQHQNFLRHKVSSRYPNRLSSYAL